VAGVISLSEVGLRLGLPSLDGTLGGYLPMERERSCAGGVHLGFREETDTPGLGHV
jgi:hypothetical protein